MKNFNPKYKEYVDSILLPLENVRQGLMFGCPGYYTDHGLAICHYNDNLFVKLSTERVAQLLIEDKNASSQGPMEPKRSMGKNWLFLSVPDFKTLQKYGPLLQESIAYVSSTPKKRPLKKALANRKKKL